MADGAAPDSFPTPPSPPSSPATARRSSMASTPVTRLTERPPDPSLTPLSPPSSPSVAAAILRGYTTSTPRRQQLLTMWLMAVVASLMEQHDTSHELVNLHMTNWREQQRGPVEEKARDGVEGPGEGAE